MSIGHVVKFSTSKSEPSEFYVQLKNGSVWKYQHPVNDAFVARFKGQVEEGKIKLRLRNYKLIRPSEGAYSRRNHA